MKYSKYAYSNKSTVVNIFKYAQNEKNVNPCGASTCGGAAPARLDVNPLIPTTYNDENEVLCKPFGGKAL